MHIKTLKIYRFLLVLLCCVFIFGGCDRAGKKNNPNTTSSDFADDTTSVTPPSIIIVESEGYELTEGTDLVTVVKTNETNTTAMMVAADTPLGLFKEAVKSKDGYTYKVVDKSGNEISDDSAIIKDGYKFILYKNGEAKAHETYTISVVTKEKIASTVSEAKAEQSRYESQLAERASSQTAHQSSLPESNPESSSQTSRPDTTSSDRSAVDISSRDTSSYTESHNSPLYGYTFTLGIENKFNGVSDLWHTKFEELEEKFNMKIVAQTRPIPYNTLMIQMDDEPDLFLTAVTSARKMARAGMCSNFNLASDLDLNKPYFNKNISDTMTFNAETYAVSFTSMGANPQGIAFNKDLISLYAPDYDIYKMYKDGTWTVDAYNEVLKACTKNLDANPSTYEICGTVSNTDIIHVALTAFTGGIATRDTRGYVQPSFTTDAGIQALQWCKNAYDNSFWKYISDINEAIDYFAAGRSATVVSYMNAVKQAALAANFSTGFVPFPKAGSQSGYIAQTNERQVFVVPRMHQGSINRSVAFINALAEINDQAVALTVNQYENAGLDDIGCNIYRWTLNNETIDFSHGVYSKDITDAIENSVLTPSKEPASAMEAIAHTAKTQTEEFYYPLTGQ